MKEVYVIYKFLRHKTKTWLRIPKIFKNKLDPNIFNFLIEELEKLEGKLDNKEWIGGYTFVNKKEFDKFIAKDNIDVQ